jgi:fructosamine-3-kinase
VSPAASLAQRIENATGRRPGRMARLSGGCIAETYKVALEGGEPVVVKRGEDLALEGWMLRYLAARSDLPVPAVISAEDDLLIMEFVETSGGLDAGAEAHAAELLAALHGVAGDAFGLERDTLIGSLHQPNPETGRWIDFFREHRLLYMAREALDAGRLAGETMHRIEAFAARLEDHLLEPPAPALIHGDMWGGNVLTRQGRIAAFVDPAIYYADPEIELAFSTLFNTFGEPFFARYREIRPIEPGFFETRRDIYNLYPLLVHVRLFGGGYAAQVEDILRRYSR